MKEAPVGVADADGLAAVREHWLPGAVRLTHLSVGFGAHHWRADTPSGPGLFVTLDRLGERHSLSSLRAANSSPDPDRLATFWQEALGWRRTHDTPDEVALEPPAGSPQEGVAPDLLFLRVPDDKAGKNRLHLDLRPDDREAEVARLESLGASRVEVGRESTVSWVVMADPEGNEFCELRTFTPEELGTL